MGISYSTFTEMFKDVHLTPYLTFRHTDDDLSDDGDDDDEFSDVDLSDNDDSDTTSHSETQINFRNLKRHPSVVYQLINTIISNKQYNDEHIMYLADFVDYYIDRDILKNNTFSKDIWSNDFETTREYISLIFKRAIEKKLTFAKFLQYLCENINNGECSGFTINDIREIRVEQTIDYMKAIKQDNMTESIRSFFQNVDSGCILLVEYDHLPLNCGEDINFTQIEPDIHKGNNAKAIVSKNKKIEIIPFETVKMEIQSRHKRSQYILDTLENSSDKFTVFKVNSIVFLGVHLKSIGNMKQAKENVNLYLTIKCIIDWLKETEDEFVVLGDFNIPFVHEDTYIGFTTKDAPWHPLQEPPLPHCLNYELMRISPTYENSVVLPKIRTSDVTFNSQAFGGKFYEDGRFGLTDHVFYYSKSHASPSMFIDFESHLHPSDDSIHCLPSITDDINKSHCSDHQAVLCNVNKDELIGVYNVLSDNCSQRSAYKKTLTFDIIDKANDILAEVLEKIYNTLDETNV